MEEEDQNNLRDVSNVRVCVIIILCGAKRLSDRNISCFIRLLVNSAILSQRKDPAACVSHLTPTEYAKVFDLVGKKCMVKCLLTDCEVDMLWETGAQGTYL